MRQSKITTELILTQQLLEDKHILEINDICIELKDINYTITSLNTYPNIYGFPWFSILKLDKSNQNLTIHYSEVIETIERLKDYFKYDYIIAIPKFLTGHAKEAIHFKSLIQIDVILKPMKWHQRWKQKLKNKYGN